MAKKRASGKKPRTIPDEIFKSMSGSQRAEALRQVGAKTAGSRIMRTVGRSEHAGKVKYRSPEAARTAANAKSFAGRMGNDSELMKVGGKKVMSYNKKRLTERTVKGKPVLTAGGEVRLTELRKIIQQTIADEVRRAARIAKRAK